MPQNILKKTPEEVIEKIERTTEKGVEQIIEDGRRKSWKNLPQRQIDFIKYQILETIDAYPKSIRPVVASIMTVCYFSIIPGAGTVSLVIFGGIGKILNISKKRK